MTIRKYKPHPSVLLPIYTSTYSYIINLLLLSSIYLLGEQALICIYIHLHLSSSVASPSLPGQLHTAGSYALGGTGIQGTGCRGRNIVNQRSMLHCLFCFRMSGVRNDGVMLRFAPSQHQEEPNCFS